MSIFIGDDFNQSLIYNFRYFDFNQSGAGAADVEVLHAKKGEYDTITALHANCPAL